MYVCMYACMYVYIYIYKYVCLCVLLYQLNCSFCFVLQSEQPRVDSRDETNTNAIHLNHKLNVCPSPFLLSYTHTRPTKLFVWFRFTV